MSLSEYQTKTKTVQAIMWDGSDAAYDAIAPIIGRSIKSYTKIDGQDIGSLTIKLNSVDTALVTLGSYIVITDASLGKFLIMDADTFNNKYEPVVNNTGFTVDNEEPIIEPSTAATTYKI